MAITPTKIILKHSFNSGAEPDPASLVNGEIAFNATDSTLFWKNQSGDLITKSLNINEDIASVIRDDYSDFLISDMNLVDGEDGDKNLVVSYYGGDIVKDLGNVRGPVGTGISPVGTYDYATEIPTAATGLSASLQRRGITVAVLLGEDNNTPEWTNTHIYVYDGVEDDTWTDLGELMGAAGPQGEVGADGATGPQGPQGIQGEVGPQGPAPIPATDIDKGIVEYSTQEEVWSADGNAPSNNTVVRAKHLLTKKDGVNAALTFADLGVGNSAGDGKIRIHPDGQVALTLNNSSTPPVDGDENPGSPVDGVLPEGYVALRRDDTDVFLDLNVGGSITSKQVGSDQTLTLNGTSIEISGGNSIELPVPVIGGMQGLTFDPVTFELTIDGGNTITLPQNTNLQDLSIVGDQLTISDGNTITLPVTAEQGQKADSAIQASDIDTLAELNSILTDAELIDTNDSRLTDPRQPLTHLHDINQLIPPEGASDGEIISYNENANEFVLSSTTFNLESSLTNTTFVKETAEGFDKILFQDTSNGDNIRYSQLSNLFEGVTSVGIGRAPSTEWGLAVQGVASTFTTGNETSGIRLGHRDGAIELWDSAIEGSPEGSFNNPYIDFKTSATQDYDCRIIKQDDGLNIQTGGNENPKNHFFFTANGEAVIGGNTQIVGDPGEGYRVPDPAPRETLDVRGNIALGTYGTDASDFDASNYISFAGTFQDPAAAFIGERRHDEPSLEKSELLIYKGNDSATTSGDRIRIASGRFKVDTFVTGLPYNPPLGFNEVGESELLINRFSISPVGNVGIGTYDDDPPMKLSIKGGTIGIDSNGNDDYGMIDQGTTNSGIGFRGSGYDASSGLDLCVTHGGQVGIGTETPSKQFEVIGETKINGYTEINGEFYVSDFIRFGLDNSNEGWPLALITATRTDGPDSPTGLKDDLRLSSNDYVSIYTDDDWASRDTTDIPKLRVIQNGNVGINTITPLEKLHVKGNIMLGEKSNDPAVFNHNYLRFAGSYADTGAFIGERRYEGTEIQKSELIIFKGNDSGATSTGPDRVRVVAGEFRFDSIDGVISDADDPDEVIGDEATFNNRLLIQNNGLTRIGPDTVAPVSTLSITDGGIAISSNGDGDWGFIDQGPDNSGIGFRGAGGNTSEDLDLLVEHNGDTVIRQGQKLTIGTDQVLPNTSGGIPTPAAPYNTSLSGTSGHVQLPGGLIMKFGTAKSNTDADQTFTFEVPFPNNMFTIHLTKQGSASTVLTYSSYNKQGFTINRNDGINNSDGAGSDGNGFCWQAIGN
jgi:hypothetical protein